MLQIDFQNQEIIDGVLEYHRDDIKDCSSEMQVSWQEYTDEKQGVMKDVEMWVKNKIYILLGPEKYQFMKRHTRLKK